MTINPKLTFEVKRQIAKRLVAGEHPKKLCFELDIPRQTMYDIRRKYTKIVEVYPDKEFPPQMDLFGEKKYKDELYLRPNRRTGTTKKKK